MKTTIYYLMILSFLLQTACSKQNEWLEVKTNKNDVVPETIEDYQAILDNFDFGLTNGNLTSPMLRTDNIALNDKDVNSLQEYEKNLFLFENVQYPNGISYQWNSGFQTMMLSNIVLDGLLTIANSTKEYANVKGQALFYRASAVYNLLNLFCKPYNKVTASGDLGLPIRTVSDVNVVITHRSSLETTYTQMIKDLHEAISLLPNNQRSLTRPTLYAAKALLAKVCLLMDDYEKANQYVNEVLKDNDKLLDFNDSIIDYGSVFRFPAHGISNPEVLFYTWSAAHDVLSPWRNSTGIVPDDLYQLYDTDDLRKNAFFVLRDQAVRYIGTYSGFEYAFAGIATNELYLIKAECSARLGDIKLAEQTLNKLLINRYKKGSYTPINFSNYEEAISNILTERRKELPLTACIRWEDLRRLNKDPNLQKTIYRQYNGQRYEMLPGSSGYVLPIPQQEIQLSGIEQN